MSIIKKTLTITVVAIFVLLIAIGIFFRWLFHVQLNSDFDFDSPYAYNNSVWICDAVNATIILSAENGDAWGTVGEDSEIYYFHFELLPSGRIPARDCEVYFPGITSNYEMAHTEVNWEKDEPCYIGVLQTSDYEGFTIVADREKDMAFWGNKEPMTLYFAREDLPYQVDFRDPENPVFHDFFR